MAEDTIDLHGQFVDEAQDILEMRIRDAQARGQTHLHVIVGKGKHSTGHVDKLKPGVEQVCRQLGLDFATEANEGRIYVDLTGGRVGSAPPLPPQPSGYQGGYASGGYPAAGYHGGGHQQHQQQHHGQQHHQQQQQQPQDDVEKLILGCVRCCVVM